MNELMYKRRVWVVQKHKRYNKLIHIPVMSDIDCERVINEETLTKEVLDLIDEGFVITKPHTSPCVCALLSKNSNLETCLLVEYFALDN